MIFETRQCGLTGSALMRKLRSYAARLAAALMMLMLLAFSGAVAADPPARVGRIAFTSGATSLSPAGPA